MKRRWIAACFAVLLLLTLATGAFAADYDGSVNVDNIVEGGKRMYASFEGPYDSVVPSDSGAVGLGILGWRGNKALELLKMICSAVPSYSRQVLGDTFYNEIVYASSYAWSSRTLNATEAANAKLLIGSSYGVDAQNELARNDIVRQIGEAWSQGIRSDAAILYYCSVSNHYGPSGAQRFMVSVRAAMGISASATINSLDALHNGVVKAAQSYDNVASTLSYRTKVYNFIKNTLQWNTSGNGSSSPTDPMPGTTPSTNPYVPTSSYYSDVPLNSWYCEGVEFVTQRGLFKGMSASTFAPSYTMTRAMLVTVLYRMEGMPALTGTNNRFADVAQGTYYYEPVLWASSNGIVRGITETQFAPDSPITREQLATMLHRYTQLRSFVIGNASAIQSFSDAASVSEYAAAGLGWAVQYGLIKGTNNGNGVLLDPKGYATRAQVATILMRYIQSN